MLWFAEKTVWYVLKLKKKKNKGKNGKRQGMILVCININRIFKFSCMREINNYY